MSFLNRFLERSYDHLLDDDDAQAFLRGRGISAEQWEKHSLGYVGGFFDVSPEEDVNHNSDCGDKEKKHNWCDICRFRRWSSSWVEVEGQPLKEQRVCGRISGGAVFPLTSYSGSVVGFQVRSIREKSYDTFLLKDRPEGYFFGASAAIESIWQTGEVTLVEGAPDALLYDRLVGPNVLAITTSAVSKLQSRFLKRFVKKVNLCLDLDKAGREGVASFVQYLGPHFSINDIKYKHPSFPCKDFGDIWKKVGDDKFSNFMKKCLAA